MPNLKNDFTWEEYKLILSHILSQNFSFSFFDEEPSDQPFIILRHDVDFSLVAAAKMAKIEYESNVRGTYCIHLGSPFYNPLVPEFLAFLHQIRNYGHEIGLHHDATIYSKNSSTEEIHYNLNIEKDLLENLLSIKIRVVSFHNPLENVRNLDLTLYGLTNTYAPKYYDSEIKYVADSDMKWRDGYILDQMKECRKIQWLVHPAHWDSDKAGVFMDRILNTTQIQSNQAIEYMRKKNRYWKEHAEIWSRTRNKNSTSIKLSP